MHVVIIFHCSLVLQDYAWLADEYLQLQYEEVGVVQIVDYQVYLTMELIFSYEALVVQTNVYMLQMEDKPL